MSKLMVLFNMGGNILSEYSSCASQHNPILPTNSPTILTSTLLKAIWYQTAFQSIDSSLMISRGSTNFVGQQFWRVKFFVWKSINFGGQQNVMTLKPLTPKNFRWCQWGWVGGWLTQFSSWIKIKLATEKQLPRLTGRALKVWLVVECWSN